MFPFSLKDHTDLLIGRPSFTKVAQQQLMMADSALSPSINMKMLILHWHPVIIAT